MDASALLDKHRLVQKKYIVMHMGTGNSLKEWPQAKWQALVKEMQGTPIVFTGKGEKEKRDAEIPGGINLVDAVNWEEYLIILKNARCLIGVDSLAGHLAAAMQLPSVLIYSGMTDIHEWCPLSDCCTVLTHPMPCAPCYRSSGCASMNCVRDVPVHAVVDAIRNIS